MIKLLMGGAGVLAALVASPAMAADFAPPPIAVIEPVFSWTGFYVGLSAGGRRSDVSWTTVTVGSPGTPPDPTTTPVDFKNSTGRAGGYLGYNWQFLPQWLMGIEADLAWGNSSKTNAGIPGTFGTSGLYALPTAANFDSVWIKQRWDASVRARMGFLVTSTWLIYATGGVALQSIEVGAICSASGDSWCAFVPSLPRYERVLYVRTGWTVGAGTEVALSRNWFARVEYRFADFGNIDYTFFTVPSTGNDVTTSVKLRSQTVLGGIAFKFD